MVKLKFAVCEHCLQLHVSCLEKLVRVLDIQYRMFPEICDFPTRHFYKGKLKSDKYVFVLVCHIHVLSKDNIQ